MGVNFCSCPDFTVNTLGTCKHIEWLLAKLRRKRGAKVCFEQGFHPPFSEVYLEYGARRKVRFREGTECPPKLRREVQKFFRKDGTLCEETVSQFERFQQSVANTRHEVQVYNDALDFIARLRDDLRRREEIARRFRSNGKQRGFDRLLKVSLYPYQQQGALFAAQAGRCLMADDMGLGKTIQSIAAVEILAQTVGIEKALVVCPTALKHQWSEEISRFTDRTARVVEGPLHIRHGIYPETDF